MENNYAFIAQQIYSKAYEKKFSSVFDKDDYKYEFKYDNLEICANDIDNPDWIIIKYNDYPVFHYYFPSYRNKEQRKKIGINIYKPGAWEKLLLEIYNLLNLFVEKKESKEREYKLKEKHSNDLLKALDKKYLISENPGTAHTRYTDYTIYKCYDLKLFPFSSGSIYIDEIGVELVTSKKSYERINGCGNEVQCTYRIYSNGELCCEFQKNDFGTIESNVSQFVIGPWEQKLIDYIQYNELLEIEQKQKKEADEVEQSILKLKKYGWKYE